MRTAVLVFAALLTVAIVACGGDREAGPVAQPSGSVVDVDQDQFRFLAEGEFIDTKPVRGSSGALVVMSGGLPGVVSRADAIVVSEITEIVDVTIPTRPAPPNFPVAEIEEYPVTTYSARVDQWVKGVGGDKLLITDVGGVTDSGPRFVDGDFLLEPGRRYVLALYEKREGLPGPGQYERAGLGLGAFEVTDGFVHVLNNPLTQDLQAQFGGMPLQEFVQVLEDYVTNPPPSPTPLPALTPAAGTPLPISTAAIDMEINDTPANTATSLGSRKACGTLKTGGTLTIDITVDALALLGEGGRGITGFQLVLVYDPSKVKVVASKHDMLLAENPGSLLVSLGDETPDGGGSFPVVVADLGQSTPQSRSGVLARITLEGVGPGVSSLELTDVIITDDSLQAYRIDNVLAAQVAVGQTCPPS